MTFPTDLTPYPAVNAVLRLLLQEVCAILGTELVVGMYCYGSLSLGDFEPGSSDIDFLIVTEHDEPMPDDTLHALAAMHARIAASGLPWADKLEGSYIPRVALRRYDPTRNQHPTIGADWAFGIGEHGSNWIIERHIIREHGVTIYGPPLRILIDPVSPDELRAAVRQALDGFWRTQLAGPEPEWLRTRDYQAFAILTMCRALYTLAHGAVVSKPAAAAWAQATLPTPWPGVIAKALTWRHDTRSADMTEMLAFIHYTIAEAEQYLGGGGL